MIKKFNKNQMQSFILSMILILTFTFNIVIVKAQNNGNELYSEVTIELQHKIINENKNLPIEERYASLNIDKEKLTGIDTDSLLNLVLEYPLLGNIFAYDNTKLGTHVLAQKFNPINVLILRKDAIHFIEQRIGSSKIENDYIKTSFLNALTEYILSSKVISDTDISMATQTTVKTPQGTSVTVIIYGEELTIERKAEINAYFDSAYPNATRISTATTNYNCHSYAWYSASTSNKYWMSNPSSYMSDGSYLKVSSSEGKKVYYPNGGNSHSGIYINGTVTSKWGQAGLYQHSLSHCPYGTTGVSYYKFNPNIPPLLSEPQFK